MQRRSPAGGGIESAQQGAKRRNSERGITPRASQNLSPNNKTKDGVAQDAVRNFLFSKEKTGQGKGVVRLSGGIE